MLFLKRCSGISLISYAIIGIKKAARKLGNWFLGVKEKKVNTMTARGIPIRYPDTTHGKLGLFLSVTLLYIRICLIEDKTATLKGMYRSIFFSPLFLWAGFP